MAEYHQLFWHCRQSLSVVSLANRGPVPLTPDRTLPRGFADNSALKYNGGRASAHGSYQVQAKGEITDSKET